MAVVCTRHVICLQSCQLSGEQLLRIDLVGEEAIVVVTPVQRMQSYWLRSAHVEKGLDTFLGFDLAVCGS